MRKSFLRVFPCLLISLLILLASTPAHPLATAPPGDPSPTGPTSAPVTTTSGKPEAAPLLFNGAILFTLRERAFSMEPKKRVEMISRRIGWLALNPSFDPDSLTVAESEFTSDILAGDTLVMAVTDQDAAAVTRPRRQLAQELLAAIRNAIVVSRDAYSPGKLLRSGLYALAATGVLILLIWGCLRLCRRLALLADFWLAEGLGLRLFSYNIVRPSYLRQLIGGILKVFRLVLIGFLVIVYLQSVLVLFPWTHAFALQLLDLVLGPLATMWHALVGYIPKLFFLAVLVVVTSYVLRFIRFLFREVEQGIIELPGFYRDWAEPTYKIVRFLVIAFAAVVAFPYIPGSDSPAFKGVSLFIGVLFSLGSSSAIGSMVAGVILTYMRPFLLGDRVKIADTAGFVVEKNLLVTRIRTIKNVKITIPNALILGTHIINYSLLAREQGLILNTVVTIGYDAPWRTVHELLIAAAGATTHILSEPHPFVLQTALNDFYVAYEINAYTDQPDLMEVIYSELHQNIQEKFNEAGLEIMSPHYAQLRDGNTTTIPQANRPADYTPPHFRVGG
jgi:small-conductance mechanosensitive channel